MGGLPFILSMGNLLTNIVDESMVNLSIEYAELYKANPKNWLTCFVRFPSVRASCAFIVNAYKRNGALAECQATGKDFTEYANKQNIPENFKRVLADMLLIIYSILNQ